MNVERDGAFERAPACCTVLQFVQEQGCRITKEAGLSLWIGRQFPQLEARFSFGLTLFQVLRGQAQSVPGDDVVGITADYGAETRERRIVTLSHQFVLPGQSQA